MMMALLHFLPMLRFHKNRKPHARIRVPSTTTKGHMRITSQQRTKRTRSARHLQPEVTRLVATSRNSRSGVSSAATWASATNGCTVASVVTTTSAHCPAPTSLTSSWAARSSFTRRRCAATAKHVDAPNPTLAVSGTPSAVSAVQLLKATFHRILLESKNAVRWALVFHAATDPINQN